MSKGVYIIAEIGPNHNGNSEIGLKMIEEISTTGVNAIKFQLTNPYALYSMDSFKASYQKKNDSAKSPLEMSLRYQLKREDHIKLYSACKECGVDYICTAFDIGSMTFLDSHIYMPYFKIASGEIFSLDIIDYISKRNKPVILSTGMATYSEISASIELINRNFKKDITILHCISNYPAKFEEVNLLNMQEIMERFNYSVGFSDHTIGNDCAIAAVAMGAKMIEKHVTFNKNAEGPDHKASIDIEELRSLVNSIRNVEVAIGVRDRIFSEQQREISKVARKSIVTAYKINKGNIIKEEDICYKRPGIGFLPIEKNLIIGKKVIIDIEADKIIKPKHILWE
ncbi:MAG: N-acetylneuraminate synthase family protein [Candidatus Azobacteroides sp.]|nr:N-acetylneuraminate synthase family protein [Candidatus Azobacteroides sp.]